MIARTMLQMAWHVMFFKFQISFETQRGAIKGNTNTKMLNLQIQAEITFIYEASRSIDRGQPEFNI